MPPLIIVAECAASAVAFHHGGLDVTDRQTIEQAFLSGDIGVICCTSTLAVGVNLPCHLVILKNTLTYEQRGLKECSDLEIMQMLGRAGRPQFDSSAIAVIMTRQEKVRHYESMVSGQEVLESCLHLNLIDHLNAEIGLGTITDPSSAKRWLMGTFLYVRMKQNAEHYRLDGDSVGGTLDERLDRICTKDIKALQDSDLITGDLPLRTTEFGEAMARYYVNFTTMKILMDLPQRAKVSDVVSVIRLRLAKSQVNLVQLAVLAQAAEFRELRFRMGEKTLYKTINSHPSIKFPIPVNLDLPAHKVSLILQSILGGVDFPDDKHRTQYNIETSLIFQHAGRLIRCIIDCQLQLDDSVAIRNALMLARSLGARVWDDSPMQMKQIPGVGYAVVRKFCNAGVRSIEQLECQEPHRIESIMGRKPGFGLKFLDELKAFPKLRISLFQIGSPHVRPDEGVWIKLKAEIGFMNNKVPVAWQRKPVYVCFLAEVSNGRKVHFARISANKLGDGQDIVFSAVLKTSTQSITCYVMCDEIAGTQREATLSPKIPSSSFGSLNVGSGDNKIIHKVSSIDACKPNMNSSKKRMFDPAFTLEEAARMDRRVSEDFSDDNLNDLDLLQAANNPAEFRDIEDIEQDLGRVNANPLEKSSKQQLKQHPQVQHSALERSWEPRRLQNGNWECNHMCKDRKRCKHKCCKDGLQSKPKPPKTKNTTIEDKGAAEKSTKVPNKSNTTQVTLETAIKRKPPTISSVPIQQIDLCSPGDRSHQPEGAADNATRAKKLQTLPLKPQSSAATHCEYESQRQSCGGNKLLLPSASHNKELQATRLSNDDDDELMDLSDLALAEENFGVDYDMKRGAEDSLENEQYDENDSVLDEAMIGLADSQELSRPGLPLSPQQSFTTAAGHSLSHSPFKVPRKKNTDYKETSRCDPISQRNELDPTRMFKLEPPRQGYKRSRTPLPPKPVKQLKSNEHAQDIEAPCVNDSNISGSTMSNGRHGPGNQVLNRESSEQETTAPADASTALRWLRDMGLADCIEIV